MNLSRNEIFGFLILLTLFGCGLGMSIIFPRIDNIAFTVLASLVIVLEVCEKWNKIIG